ncbi:hypothetical protein Peur_066307 [Populus x canadensis]
MESESAVAKQMNIAMKGHPTLEKNSIAQELARWFLKCFLSVKAISSNTSNLSDPDQFESHGNYCSYRYDQEN